MLVHQRVSMILSVLALGSSLSKNGVGTIWEMVDDKTRGAAVQWQLASWCHPHPCFSKCTLAASVTGLYRTHRILLLSTPYVCVCVCVFPNRINRSKSPTKRDHGLWGMLNVRGFALRYFYHKPRVDKQSFAVQPCTRKVRSLAPPSCWVCGGGSRPAPGLHFSCGVFGHGDMVTIIST